MSNRKRGIYKGISEPVYPADILAERDLALAPLEVKGAWFWTLLHLWRTKAHSLTDSIDGFAAEWRCCNADVTRIIGYIEAHKIANVTRLCNGDVTLTCRRLERRVTERDRIRNAVAKVRCNENVTDHVTQKKPAPSFSSSFSSSVPTGGGSPSSTENMIVNNFVSQFVQKTGWTGGTEKVYEHIRSLVHQHPDGHRIQAALDTCALGELPWDFGRRVNGVKPRDGTGVRKEAPVKFYNPKDYDNPQPGDADYRGS